MLRTGPVSEDRDRRAALTRKFQSDWEQAQRAVVPLELALAAKYQSVLASHGREAVRIFEQAALTAAAFDPSKHPRYPRGVREGGRFTSRGLAVEKYGDSLEIRGDPDTEVVKKHLKYLNRVPQELVDEVRSHGVRVLVTDGPLTGLNEFSHLGKVMVEDPTQSRTWGGGAYSPSKNLVGLGSGGTGSTSTALHEYGHGVASTMGLEGDKVLRQEYEGVRSTLPAYLGQEGFRGYQETLAESFADIMVAPERASRIYGPGFVSRMLSDLGLEPGDLPPSMALTAGGEQRPLPGTVPDELIPPEKFKASIRARTEAARKRIVNEVASILLGSILAEKAASIPMFASILDSLAEQQAQYALEAQQDAVSSVILDAHQNGWSVEETSDELRKVLKDYAPWQATRLARTDLISLANATSLASAQLLPNENQPRYKIWLTAQDDRVREAHVKADRQAVPLDQPFSVEGVTMMYPGDPTAPAELIMNCRCTQVYADTPNPVLAHSSNGGNQEGDELALAAAGLFDEAKHPRHERGGIQGGEFKSKFEVSVLPSVEGQAGSLDEELKSWSDEGAVDHANNALFSDEEVILVRESGRLVGVASLYDDGDSLWISSIGSDSKGAGRTMVQQAASLSKQRSLSLKVAAEPGARGFYRHLGFSDIGGPEGASRITYMELPEQESTTAAGWNAALHPRYERGVEKGGQFAPKDGTSSHEAQTQAYEAAQGKQEMERTRLSGKIGEVPTDNEQLRSDLLSKDLTDAQRTEWERAYREGGGFWPRNLKDWETEEGVRLREEMTQAPILAAAVDHTAGSMIALYPERPELLAQVDGQPAEDLHVTLAFLPEGYNGNTDLLTKILAGVAGTSPVLEGQVGGVGYFTPGENGVPMIALPDVDGLAEIRQSVVNALDVTGTTYAQDHGFTPHITLTYTEVESPETPDVIGIPLRFTHLCLVAGPEKAEFPFDTAVTSAATEAKVPKNGEEMRYEPRPDAPVAERVVALRSILPELEIAEVLAAEDEWFEPGVYERVGATRDEVIAMYAAASRSTLIPVDIPPTTITFSPQFLIQVPAQAAPVVHVSVPEQAPQPAPVIEVNVPAQPAPQVTVEAPNVTVEAPNVTVQSPEINIPETVVNVAAPKAPIVNVTVPENDRKVSFKRDNRGQIISAEIEEE